MRLIDLLDSARGVAARRAGFGADANASEETANGPPGLAGVTVYLHVRAAAER